MKRTMYFSSEEELNNYFKSGVPSGVLAIVQPDAESPAVLYTSSNNSPVGGGSSEGQGGPGVTPTGTYNIAENGEYDVTTYAYAYVDVPETLPTGTYNITYNGEYDVTSYANAYVNVPLGSAYFYVVRNPEEENEEIIPFVDHTAEAGYPCFSYNFGNFEYTQGEGAQLVIFPVSSEEEGVDKTGIKAKIESTFFNTEGQDPVYIYAAGPTTIETANDSAEAQVTIGQIETADSDNEPAVYITRSISNLKLYIEKLHSSSTWSGRWEWV